MYANIYLPNLERLKLLDGLLKSNNYTRCGGRVVCVIVRAKSSYKTTVAKDKRPKSLSVYYCWIITLSPPLPVSNINSSRAKYSAAAAFNEYLASHASRQTSTPNLWRVLDIPEMYKTSKMQYIRNRLKRN